jgi:hypothetical protein
MARNTPNLGLKVWNLPSDPYIPNDLVLNWDAIDAKFSSASVDTVPSRFIESGAALPGSSLSQGRLFYLTATNGGFAANSLVRYDGSAWRAVGPIEVFSALPSSGNYSGRMVVLSAADGGFSQWDVVLYNGASWQKLSRTIDIVSAVPGSGNYAGRIVVLTSPVNTGGYIFSAYDVIRFDGTAWKLVGPYVTTEGYGTALPGAPIDGQIYTLVDSTTNPSYQWRFRFNAGSSSTYKWEFIGGSSATVYNSGGSAPGILSGWATISTGVSFALPRSGDYEVIASTYITASTAVQGQNLFGIALGDTTPFVYGAYVNSQPLYDSSMVLTTKVTGGSSGTNVKTRYWASDLTGMSFSQNSIGVRPSRVI